MTIKDVIDFLHTIAPNHYQEDYDNSGFLVGSSDHNLSGVLVSLDVTEAVIDEAISIGANLIVSHHPIIFTGIKRLTQSNYVERIVYKAIKNDINLFAIHTNLDNVYDNGVNTNIAQRIGLTDVNILSKKEVSDSDKPVGSGVIGYLSAPQDELEFLSNLKSIMQTNCIKHTSLKGQKVHKIAICGGSGRFLLDEAIRQEADVFISSDFKYHEFFDADGKIVIADIGHYESEQFTINMLHKILTNKFNTFATHYTKVNTNPVNYL